MQNSQNLEIKFDTSVEAFKQWTPDQPQNIDWDRQLLKGLFVLSVPCVEIAGIVNQNSISLLPTQILNDVDPRKWQRLNSAVRAGQIMSLPWGRVDSHGLLVVAQGKHRFQYQIVHKVPNVTFAMTGDDLESWPRFKEFSVSAAK